MPVVAYRVCRRIYARLDGEGANRVGGRWNSPGQPVVYMAQSVALAVLENLVHMSREDYPTGYVVVKATIPDHVLILDRARFLNEDAPKENREREAGNTWLKSRESSVLRVPSAVVQGEWNHLINPKHIDFAQITVDAPIALLFDERLFEHQ